MSKNQSHKLEEELEHETSKSEVKKQMLALQQLGEKIVALSDSQLKKIPLDDRLLDAINLARKITKHGGLKRQLQYVGKLMRHVDPEPIESALDEIENGYQQDNQVFHLKEQWRDRLLTEGNQSLTEFVNLHPTTDLQRLRQLIRVYGTAKSDDKKKHTARLLFKLVAEKIDQKP